jgi:alkyl hydroperoxide reductase subunit AhpC
LSYYDLIINFYAITVAQVQQPAPNFTAPGVVNGEIVEKISLADYKGKYVVFFWYPLDFTFVCPTEINAFNDRIEEFRSLNCEVLAASCDSGNKRILSTKKTH